MGTGSILSLAQVWGTIPSTPLEWFFPQPQGFSSDGYADQYSADYQGQGDSRVQSLCRFHLCLTLSYELQLPEASLSPQLGLDWGSPSLNGGLETRSRQQTGAIVGLGLYFIHLSGITVLSCLMSNFLKIASSCIISICLVVSGEEIILKVTCVFSSMILKEKSKFSIYSLSCDREGRNHS